MARVLIRFCTLPRKSTVTSPSGGAEMELEQLFLELRVGDTQCITNLAPQELGLLAYERDEMIIINLLYSDEGAEGDVRVSGQSVTMWQIPIRAMEPLDPKEVLLRGSSSMAAPPLQATLLLVPLQPLVHVRRKRLMLWDGHGFAVHNSFEEQYLRWERNHANQEHESCSPRSPKGPKSIRASWEKRRLNRPFSTDGFPVRAELEDLTLLRRGLPDFLRSQVWQELAGADLVSATRSEDYYEELVREANVEGTEWYKDIVQDIPRTFPDHPLLCDLRGRQMLERVLLAYSLHNPKIGYCQGMNFLVGFLLLYMDERSAFWCLSRICNDRMAGYYMKGMIQAQVDQMILSLLIEDLLPQLHQHFEYFDVSLSTITMRWSHNITSHPGSLLAH